MKKIAITCLFSMIAVYCHSQNFLDLRRYSFTANFGTARSMGMGGAIGATGIDYSVSSVNPASLAQIRSSQAMVTLGLNFSSTRANFLNNDVTDNRFSFSLPNMGAVVSTIRYERGKEVKKGLVNYSFAFGFNRINDFNRNITMEGFNNQSSYLDNLAELATQNIDFASVSGGFTPQYPEELALAAGAIRHVGNNQYEANLPAQANIRQGVRIQQSGRQADWNISWAGNFSHVMYVGFGIGIPGLRFNQTETIYETTFDDSIKPSRSFQQVNQTSTSGTGLNAKMGVTFRLADWIRIGAAYHTPTNWSLQDAFSYNFTSNNFPNSQFVYTDGELLVAGPYDSRYKFTTPGKTVLSAAFIIKKLAIIGIDYERVNYTTARTSETDLEFINQAVRANFRQASNLRVGAEYSYLDYRFRAGYAIYAPPFKKDILNALTEGNLALQIYSIGGGYVDPGSGIFFDAAVVYEHVEDFYTPYTLQPGGRPYYSSLNRTNNTRLMFTLGTKF